MCHLGFGLHSTKNIALATNYAELGTAEASAGFGNYSNRNKATATESGAEAHVNVAHNHNQDDSGAQLANTAGGCQEALVAVPVGTFTFRWDMKGRPKRACAKSLPPFLVCKWNSFPLSKIHLLGRGIGETSF